MILDPFPKKILTKKARKNQLKLKILAVFKAENYYFYPLYVFIYSIQYET